MKRLSILMLLTLISMGLYPMTKSEIIKDEIKVKERKVIITSPNATFSLEFQDSLFKMCDTLDIKVEHMLAVFHVETIGTFLPDKRSPIGATGLIQFTSSTAKWIGTSTTELAKMSRSKQLKHVAKYFHNIIKYYGKLSTLDNVFMAVHYPIAIRSGRYSTIYKEGSKAYYNNRFNDRNNDGIVSKYEISNFVRQIYNKYYKDLQFANHES